ncbi:sensor histidine kinase [Salisediminibacterium beveridgei]|uniref:histidine kinase n=1 Tax=Salisediminibacterium beveridgei TaxID=632773 RepID=A0A1D7QRA1_9BACI|nr:PAS domain-containing sensor histidine kinase [Salisediminibacterium beveridgei]AOM81500.1 histidine kinase/response regulator hybrid protein [Salisediminibacterium beveridgei]
MFRSLRSKLIVFFILVTVIPMAIVGMIGYNSQKHEISSQLEYSIMSQSSNLSAELLNLIDERLRDVEWLTRSPILRDPESTPLELREELYNFLSVNDIYFDAILLNEEGGVIVDTETRMIGRNIGDREWFQEVSETGMKRMSDIYMSDAINRPVLVLGAPVYTHDRELLFYVSPSFNLDVFYERIEAYTTLQRTHGSDGYAFLLREDGLLLSHPNQSLVMNMNYFEQQDITKDDLNSLIDQDRTFTTSGGQVHAFTQVEEIQGFEHRWYVGIALAEEDLYASLDDLLLRYVAFYFLIFAVLIVAVIKLSDYLVKPIRQLVEKTKAYAEGVDYEWPYEAAYREADHLHVAFDDMTGRLKEREATHRKSTQVLEATDNGVFAVARGSEQLTMSNREFETLFGFTEMDLSSVTIQELKRESPFFDAFMHAALDEWTEFDKRNETRRQAEVNCQDQDGNERIFFLGMTLLSANGEREDLDEFLFVFQELTEVRRMERELVQSEKLGMIGQMAAGLAHEIRNPMTTIRGFMQLLEKRDDGENARYYQLIMNEIDQVNKVMEELMHIGNPARIEEETTSETSVSEQLKEIITLHEQDLEKRQIKVETFFNGTDDFLETNRNKLRQVFSNIIRNAIEAMPDGGRLKLRNQTAPGLDANGVCDVVVAISDTGEGMDSETIKKAGTPFFTTKENGHGLGLATTYRIIEELGGTIDIRTKAGEGTTFVIRLPGSVLRQTVNSGE